MKSVHYLHPRANFTRSLRVKDLDALGIEVKEDLVFEPKNKFTIVLSNKTSDSLVAALPKEFKAYPADGDDESPEVLEPLTALHPSSSTEIDSSSSDDSEDEPVASLSEEDVTSTSSTPKRRRNS